MGQELQQALAGSEGELQRLEEEITALDDQLMAEHIPGQRESAPGSFLDHLRPALCIHGCNHHASQLKPP